VLPKRLDIFPASWYGFSMSTRTQPVYRNVVIDGDKVSGELLYGAGPKRTVRVIEHTAEGTTTEEAEVALPDSWFSFQADLKLLHIDIAIKDNELALRAVWALMDAHGPTQEAIDAMYDVARLYLSDEDFRLILGVKA
jgi:hypothetical protein